MTIKNIKTRFRAYKLGSSGSSFSYFADNHFTLIEARYTDINKQSIKNEKQECGVTSINTMHINSWGQDHCTSDQLQEILDNLRPSRIECPGYQPSTETGTRSLRIIEKYKSDSNSSDVKIEHVTPRYINDLAGLENMDMTIFI